MLTANTKMNEKYFNKQKINTLPVSLKQLVNSLTFKDLQHQEEA